MNIASEDGRLSRLRELVSIFEIMSATLEVGRRLADLHKHHEAGLEDDLERMHGLVVQGEFRRQEKLAQWTA